MIKLYIGKLFSSTYGFSDELHVVTFLKDDQRQLSSFGPISEYLLELYSYHIDITPHHLHIMTMQEQNYIKQKLHSFFIIVQLLLRDPSSSYYPAYSSPQYWNVDMLITTKSVDDIITALRKALDFYLEL